MSQEFPELGIYTLPGRINDPRRTLEEVPLAETLGSVQYGLQNATILRMLRFCVVRRQRSRQRLK